MKFESLYDVNDILQYKFSNSNSCFEVMEIVSVTCSAGTQIFYKVRPMNFDYDFVLEDIKKEGEQPKRVKKFVGANPAFVQSQPASYIQLREDELKPASQETKDLLASVQKL